MGLCFNLLIAGLSLTWTYDIQHGISRFFTNLRQLPFKHFNWFADYIYIERERERILILPYFLDAKESTNPLLQWTSTQHGTYISEAEAGRHCSVLESPTCSLGQMGITIDTWRWETMGNMSSSRALSASALAGRSNTSTWNQDESRWIKMNQVKRTRTPSWGMVQGKMLDTLLLNCHITWYLTQAGWSSRWLKKNNHRKTYLEKNVLCVPKFFSCDSTMPSGNKTWFAGQSPSYPLKPPLSAGIFQPAIVESLLTPIKSHVLLFKSTFLLHFCL